MRHGSLFSGIGGFDLAAQWMGWENVFQVEIDEYCQKVLAKNFPNVKQYGDIKEFKGKAGSVDILTGGFPCQPFSTAGKRKGESDDRYLWPEYLRIIREIQPTYVVGENVAGLISMEDGDTLDGILIDLEGEGYETEQFIIPACGVGAWHRRDRIWIIAYNEKRRWSGKSITKYGRKNGSRIQNRKICSNVSNTNSKFSWKIRKESDRYKKRKATNDFGQIRGNRTDVSNSTDTGTKGVHQWKNLSNKGQWGSESNVGRVANGISRRVDRLKGLGNAIVPQVALEIFKAIEQLNENN